MTHWGQDPYLAGAGSEDESGGSDYEEAPDLAGGRHASAVDSDDDADADASDEDMEGGFSIITTPCHMHRC